MQVGTSQPRSVSRWALRNLLDEYAIRGFQESVKGHH